MDGFEKALDVGILASGFGYFAYVLAYSLSESSSSEKKDPTWFFRIWKGVYNQYFHQVARQVGNENRDQTINGALYQLAIGLVTMVWVMVIYLFLSGTAIAAVVVSYYSAGVAPNISSLIEFFAGGSLLFGIAVIVQATEISIGQIQE